MKDTLVGCIFVFIYQREGWTTHGIDYTQVLTKRFDESSFPNSHGAFKQKNIMF
jgi:hypothetical protein